MATSGDRNLAIDTSPTGESELPVSILPSIDSKTGWGVSANGRPAQAITHKYHQLASGLRTSELRS